MTKNPLLIAILLTLLTACMSSPEGAPAPQVTVTPEATITSTPLPTETPLPTLTPTPVTVDGIAEDAEGNKLAYLNGEWLTLTNLPSDGDLKLKVDGEKVVAVDAEGQIAYEYDMAAGNWVEVEKTYPSCAMPELIAEQDAGFTERTGIDLNDVEHPFMQAVNKITSVGWRPETKDIVTMQVVKTGFGEVNIDHPQISKLVCIYGRNGVIPGETMVFVMGWYDNGGSYHPLTLIRDAVTGQDLSKNILERGFIDLRDSKQLGLLRDMPDGGKMQVIVHTFSGRETIDDVQSELDWDPINLDGVRRFLRIITNDYRVRQLGELSDGNVMAFWHNQSPKAGDVGFIPGSAILYYAILEMHK